MKRWTLRIFVFLLLGAIVNVAVAWGIALLLNPLDDAIDSRPRGSIRQAIDYGETTWFVWSNRRVGSWWVLSSPRFQPSYDRPDTETPPSALLPSWVRDDFTPKVVITTRGAEFDSALRTVHATGWPLLAVSGMYAGVRAENPIGASAITMGYSPWTRGPAIPGQFTVQRSLLLCPIWPGFAINTVFYAVVLWLLFAGPFVVRRWRRIRRGLCPKCAYPVGTSNTCTECGAALPRPS